MAEPVAGNGGAVAEFGCQRLHKTGTPQIAAEQFVHQLRYIFKITAPFHKGLIDGRGIGDVKIIAAASVVFGVDTVQGKGNDRQDIGAQGAFRPRRINLAGGDVFDIVREGNCDIPGRGVRRAQVYGDGFRNERENIRLSWHRRLRVRDSERSRAPLRRNPVPRR